MLNNRKVRLMTQLAIYEKKEGKEDIRLSKYYKSDYARFGVLRTALAVTFSYIFILAIIAFYNLEFIIENVMKFDYIVLGKRILAIYLAIMAVYLICAMVGYSFKYKASRKKLGKYYRMLRKLKDIYNEEDRYMAQNTETVIPEFETYSEEEDDKTDI